MHSVKAASQLHKMTEKQPRKLFKFTFDAEPAHEVLHLADRSDIASLQHEQLPRKRLIHS